MIFFLYYIGKYEQKLLVLPTKRLEKCISSIVVALSARVRGMVKTAVGLGASFVTRTGIT